MFLKLAGGGAPAGRPRPLATTPFALPSCPQGLLPCSRALRGTGFPGGSRQGIAALTRAGAFFWPTPSGAVLWSRHLCFVVSSNGADVPAGGFCIAVFLDTTFQVLC